MLGQMMLSNPDNIMKSYPFQLSGGMRQRVGIAMVMTLYTIVPVLAVMGVSVYVLVLLIRALRKYLRTAPVRAEKAETAKTLGAVLKQHRTACKMTQEFVAESIGVSRQAVSKWESGASDPSTSNLLALAKLFGIDAKELLDETKNAE